MFCQHVHAPPHLALHFAERCLVDFCYANQQRHAGMLPVLQATVFLFQTVTGLIKR